MVVRGILSRKLVVLGVPTVEEEMRHKTLQGNHAEKLKWYKENEAKAMTMKTARRDYCPSYTAHT